MASLLKKTGIAAETKPGAVTPAEYVALTNAFNASPHRPDLDAILAGAGTDAYELK
jgi:hypothetical protein